MITEQQRLNMLRILAVGTINPDDMDNVITKLKEQGVDATPEYVRQAISFLKAQKGS